MEFIYLSLNFFRLPDIMLFVVIIRVYFIIILMAFEQETWLCLCYIVSQQFDLVSMCVTLIAINDAAHDLTPSAICGNCIVYHIVCLQTTTLHLQTCCWERMHMSAVAYILSFS